MDIDMDIDKLYVDEDFRRCTPEDVNSDDEGLKDEEPDEERCLHYIEQALQYEHQYLLVFNGVINDLPFDTLEREFPRILSLMFMWDSAMCAAAVFDGQAKLSKMPAWTAWTSRVDNGALHEAAAAGAFKMAALLLQKGFSADVRGDYESLKAVLPLDVILSKIRDRTRAASSPVKLVRQLCEQSIGMQRMLETLRVIAKNTSDVKGVFFNYLKDGKMVEVAALLLMARSRVLSSSPGTATATAKGEFQSISEMHDFVLNAKCQISPTDTAKLVDMEETLVLLELFDKIGLKLAQLIRLDYLSIFNVAGRSCSSVIAEYLMETAGFDVEPRPMLLGHFE